MKMKTKAGIKIVLLAIAMLVLSYAVAALVPTGPSEVSVGISDRRNATDGPGVAVQAQAGNVTALNLNSTKVTNRWQGYYGNISGVITLDDAMNNTLYNWRLASPQGEVYAVNKSRTPVWANVECFNFTDPSQNVSLANLETYIGAATTDRDGVNETFNLTYTGSFSAGSKTILAGDECPIASLYSGDQWTGVSFNETILFENQTAESVIFVSLLEQDRTGFSGSTLDFEMLVGENGDNINPTTYYFYVELT